MSAYRFTGPAPPVSFYMDYGGYAPMLRITMNGATMNGAVVTSAGVQRSLLPLQLTLSPHASCLTFSDVLNNSCYAAPFEGVGTLVQLDGLRARRWVRGAQHQRARVHLGWQHIELVGLVMLALALCAGPETGGTVLTILLTHLASHTDSRRGACTWRPLRVVVARLSGGAMLSAGRFRELPLPAAAAAADP